MGQYIDKEVAANYKLWPNNYIAYDLLEDSETFKDKYTETEKSTFISYIENSLKYIEGNSKEIYQLFLNLYANPLKNNL